MTAASDPDDQAKALCRFTPEERHRLRLITEGFWFDIQVEAAARGEDVPTNMAEADVRLLESILGKPPRPGKGSPDD